ncbi:signal transduction histidine kinase [Chitinivorax tropicus]|uniref:Signal transduction histidine kinase n=1 Tax=Chitinivorax tropicus TaxID=714531 RepID=A0A840MM27_9PROT|nr:HAMP domain-containing histidine kinase [Chitinivorax tropicus]MBB5017253.1 signal transduction histidine kinase [Chitinivorax tropicus]
MHPTIIQVIEGVSEGLIWTGADARIKLMNQIAQTATGMQPGQIVSDKNLLKAMAAVRKPEHLNGIEQDIVDASAPGTLLKAKVMPSVSKDEAIILIKARQSVVTNLAVDNLMTVIREDLRQPANTFIQQLRKSQQAQEGTELGATLDKLAEISELLSKLVDLAQLWGSQSLLTDDRILLDPLINQIWEELAPLASRRRLKVALTTHGEESAPVYGSEFWIRRVFYECLRSAINNAQAGATLEIERRQMGPRLMVGFRNCGLFNNVKARAGSAMLEAKGNDPAQSYQVISPSSADLVGLHLCQRIIELHGGVLREDKEDGDTNFVIDLPCGAPYRAQHAEIDAMQAQRYAEDMSRLLARSRKKAAA